MSRSQRTTPIMQLPLQEALKSLIDLAISKHPGKYGSRSDFMRKSAFAYSKETLAASPAHDVDAEVASALTEFKS